VRWRNAPVKISAFWYVLAAMPLALVKSVIAIRRNCPLKTAEIADWLLRLRAVHKRWGFRLCFSYLRSIKHFGWSHKRAYRLYRELEFNLRIKPRKRIKSHTQQVGLSQCGSDCKESGVIQERFTFHDLRSYAADEQDCDASKLLGHANKETTERIYLRRVKKVTPNR